MPICSKNSYIGHINDIPNPFVRADFGLFLPGQFAINIPHHRVCFVESVV